ncbi:hypothetical protein BRC79_05875 [Halobacteriales archaeon QH_8_67_27]|nr:MAG: hypothetical protein BRC79_05875 [Halobacteriales archaeon QH_8_67_27]
MAVGVGRGVFVGVNVRVGVAVGNAVAVWVSVGVFIDVVVLLSICEFFESRPTSKYTETIAKEPKSTIDPIRNNNTKLYALSFLNNFLLSCYFNKVYSGHITPVLLFPGGTRPVRVLVFLEPLFSSLFVSA